MKGNLFSKHDNRHAFQNSGCYFGQGLGKRLQKDDSKNQHHSENHTTWRSPPSYVSIYRGGYCSTGTEHERRRCSSVNCTPVSTSHVCKHSTARADGELLSKFETVTKTSFRRFPRSHSLPEKMANVRPSECTNWWYRQPSTQKTSTHHTQPSTQKISTHHTETTAEKKDTIARDSTKKEQVFVTPLSVLAATQQPFLRYNPWTYSFKK